MDYFPHDTDAGGDDKLEALILVHGLEGYAIYFLLLERIYRRQDLQIDVSDSETGVETRQILCRKYSITEEKLLSILKTAVRWNLFDKDAFEQHGIVTSDAIKRRAAGVLDKREKSKENYNSKNDISGAETAQKPDRNIPETPDFCPERKEKKRKEKENNTALSFSSPLFMQIWLLYPVQKEKESAEKAWREFKCDERFIEIREALIRQKAEKTDAAATGTFYPEFPYLAKWIKKKRWTDEPVKMVEPQAEKREVIR